MPLYPEDTYGLFLKSKTADKWERFGAKRRAGVLAPLFSLYSKNSTGIGEIPDIKLLADWCVQAGLSVIQLLPMNDAGFNFTPYDCQSTFALDPMYLRIDEIKGNKKHEAEIVKLKVKFPAGAKRVNYKVKGEKLRILFDIFSDFDIENKEYKKFKSANKFWLDDYAAYKALKDKYEQKSWTDWEEVYRLREEDAVKLFCEQESAAFEFYRWLQYELYLQFADAKKYCNDKGVFLQGDIPFLVSRDSADVWANQNYFKLNLSSGAPPDMYFAKGQKWGMPPYNWERIEKHGFDYLIEKVKYSENFYDMFRIDHFVGLFRLWTISTDEPDNTYGLNGAFDPPEEDKWKEAGQKILDAMINSCDMLPCAEDLGVVPVCSYETLLEYGIPGMDVQRWTRDWGNSYDYKNPGQYRVNASAIISSHDTSPFLLWWKEECGTVDALLVEKLCEENNFETGAVRKALFQPAAKNAARIRFKTELKSAEDVLSALNASRDKAWMFYDMFNEAAFEKKKFMYFTGCNDNSTEKELVKAALVKANETVSVFSIQLIVDWLSLGNVFDKWDIRDTRINVPGSVDNSNWSIVMPLSLEEMLSLEINGQIKEIVKKADRI
ncbi:MAG: 4-alpha-glucanotransferase [Candidatus Goldbacteria bacterium]|nr:4-alpha-glucanotransferase [Candidatus Goldiibacteriota bacterium]